MDIKTYADKDSSKSSGSASKTYFQEFGFLYELIEFILVPFKDQILLALLGDSAAEKRSLTVKLTAQGQITLYWLRYISHSEFTVETLLTNETMFAARTVINTPDIQPGHWQKVMLKR